MRRGVGPECFMRLLAAQRHERHVSIDARLRGLLRRLGDLDVVDLALIMAMLDDLDEVLG